jgi:hypothetical protein
MQIWFGVPMGRGKSGKSLAIFIVLMFFGGVAAGLVVFSLALTLYPGPGTGQMALVSSQVEGDAMISSVVATLNNTGSKALVIDRVAVLGVNYTFDAAAAGVPGISGWWGFAVNGTNSTSLGIGKEGVLYINTSGRIDPSAVSQVSIVAQDGTLLHFNVTKA